MTTRQSLIEKYGSEEAVSEHYRQLGERSKDHPNRKKGTAKTGMAVLVETNPEKASEISRLGGQKGKRGKAKK